MIAKLIIIFLLPIYIFAQTVTLYSECNDKPYAYCIDNKPRGISVEIFKEIFSRIDDYSLKIKAIDWNSGLQKMKDKEILMLGTMKHKPKERPYITDYSLPFLYKTYVLYCNKEIKKNPLWPKDFYDLKIGYSKDFEEDAKNPKLTLKRDNIDTNIKNLIENKTDCYLSTEAVIKRELLVNKDKNISVDNIKKVLTFRKTPRYIGFSNKFFSAKKDLLNKINLSIRTINNGDIKGIIDKSLDIYLHPNRKRKVSISLYKWGEKLVSDKLEGYGAIPQIVRSAFKQRDIEVNYTFYNFKYAYLLTKWGKECVSMPWLKNKEREIYFDFSENIKSTGLYLFYKKSKYPKGINSDLKIYKIGGVNGYYYDNSFKNNLELNYISFETMNSAIKALLKGKIDVIPADKSRFKIHLKINFYNQRDDIDYNREPIEEAKNYLIFSKRCKNSQELRDGFNIGLKSIKKSGIFDEILDKFGLDKKEFK